MKKILLSLLSGVFFFLFLFINNAYYARAANMTAVDFSAENPQILGMGDGDAIIFLANNKDIVIAVDDVGKTTVRLKGTGYKGEERQVFYAPINKKTFTRLDFENDKIPDIEVKVIDIKDDKATLSFNRLFEGDIVPYVVGNDNSLIIDKDKGSFYKNGFIIFGLIVFIGLIVLIFVKKD